jgi:hypothetical protein
MSEVFKKSKARAKNNDLPAGAHDKDRFRRVFIPTLIWFEGYQPDGWKVDDDEHIRAMQAIWLTSFGSSVPHKIQLNDPIFQVVRRDLIYYTV